MMAIASILALASLISSVASMTWLSLFELDVPLFDDPTEQRIFGVRSPFAQLNVQMET